MQLPGNPLHRPALGMKGPANARDRIHSLQLPLHPLPKSGWSDETSGGSKLDADHPANGVNFACRNTDADPTGGSGLGLRPGFPSVQVDTFKLQGPPQAFAENGVETALLAVYRDPGADPFQPISLRERSEYKVRFSGRCSKKIILQRASSKASEGFQ